MSTIWAVILCASLATNVVLLLGVVYWWRVAGQIERDPPRALTALFAPVAALRGRGFYVQSTGQVVEIDPTPAPLPPAPPEGFDPDFAAFFEAARRERFDVGTAIRDLGLWASLGESWVVLLARYRPVPNRSDCGMPSPVGGYCAALPGPKCLRHGGPPTVPAGLSTWGYGAACPEPSDAPCESCVRRRGAPAP